MTRVRTLAVSLVLFLFAGVAEASWYDDYDAGLAAAKKGNWSVVVTKMTAAIKGNPKEDNKARAYGVIFYNYHPYYYRGVAHLNMGNYEAAIADLEKTSGPGPENLGDIGTLIDRAKRQLAAANEPEPAPVRPPAETTRPAPSIPAPVQTQPAAPAIDPVLRGRASNALNQAKAKLQAAQSRRATTSQQYTQAMSMFTEATTKNASARSNEDLNAIIDMAENAGTLAELAMPVTAAAAPAPATIVPSPGGITPKPASATSQVLADYSRDVRRALENYFAGEFEAATRDFEYLSRQMPGNGWIWAFLGASQYSVYAFEADDAYRSAALKSFEKAKQLKKWNGGLPEKYFSKRIRNAFAKVSG